MKSSIHPLAKSRHELTDWFKAEAGKQGAGISLSDYTLGFAQGYMVDELLRDHPEVKGMELRMDKDDKVVPETLPWSLNPMHPMSGKWYAERFFGQFEKRFPGEAGKGLNFFFSDELEFGVSGRLWSDGFAEEFCKRKGYDIVPELRLDCYDVLAALSEEGFFKPVFDWHQQRGMILGCDHGGRGKRVDEFGDYFRTQRWNQGPGADQPWLGKDLIKAKVAASAEVRVNGQAADILAAPPWKLDIYAFTKPGENRIEVLVCNTLANHYVTIPTHYRGSTVSGLLGPVRLEMGGR